MQGIELLSTGTITLPIPEPDLTYILEVKTGEHTKEDVLIRVNELRNQLYDLSATSPLPDHPDWAAINTWLTETYQAWWNGE